MTLVDAIQQYQAIIQEEAVGETINLRSRKHLLMLSKFLTKQLGSMAVVSLRDDAVNMVRKK